MIKKLTKVSHIKSSLKFELSADSLKWAIHSFSLTLFTCHPTCKTCSSSSSNMCTSCFLNGKLQDDNSCMCENGFYLDLSTNELSYPSGICRLCEFSCKKCDKFDECSECWEGMELIAKKCIFKGFIFKKWIIFRFILLSSWIGKILFI